MHFNVILMPRSLQKIGKSTKINIIIYLNNTYSIYKESVTPIELQYVLKVIKLAISNKNKRGFSVVFLSLTVNNSDYC